LADVTGDLGEADQLAVIVVNGVHHGIGPEAAAVLADSPTFRFEPAFLGGASERLFGQFRLAVLPAEEAGEMLSDDLVWAVALDALRAGVPAGYMAVRVHHVDGVV